MPKPKKKLRRPRWTANLRRGPGIDVNILKGSQFVGLVHRAVARVASLKTRETVLTGKVLRKNRLEHPEMDAYYGMLAEVIARPDYIAKNRRDPQVAVFYKEISRETLRATVILSDNPMERANSVVSYRKCHHSDLAADRKAGRLVMEPPEAG